MHRLVLALTLLAALAALPLAALAQSAPHCPPGQAPQFGRGFAALKQQLGPIMGEPLECEHANPENGDALQQTTSGLAFWRKSTNTPSFTNGSQHWALTPHGLVSWSGTSLDPPVSAPDGSGTPRAEATAEAGGLSGRITELQLSARAASGGRTALAVEVTLAGETQTRLVIEDWYGNDPVPAARASLLALLTEAAASGAFVTLDLQEVPLPSGETVMQVTAVSLRRHPSPTPPSVGQVAPDAVSAPLGLVLDDAAARLGVGRETLRIEAGVLERWSGSSISCDNGIRTEVPLEVEQDSTLGYTIWVVGAGQVLRYNTDTGDRLVLCAVEPLERAQ